MSAPQKVGFKARHNRRRRPVPHSPHRKATAYSRVGRRLKQRMALLFAPTVAESLSDHEAALALRPCTAGIVAVSTREAPASVWRRHSA